MSDSLSEFHARYLAERGVTDPTIISVRGYRSFDRRTSSHDPQLPPEYASGTPAHGHASVSGGLVIPLYGMDNPTDVAVHQLRYDSPRSDMHGARKLKFELPAGVKRGPDIGSLPADVHPVASLDWYDYQDNHEQCALAGVHGGCDLDGAAYAPLPLIITEGIVKADSILEAARREGIAIVPVALTGVTMGYQRPDGGGDPVLVESLAWVAGHTVYLAWDADMHTNPMVTDALRSTAAALVAVGATVLVVDMAEAGGGEKDGIDDLLARGVPLADILATAGPIEDVIGLIGRLQGETADMPAWDGTQDAMAARVVARFRQPDASYRCVRDGNQRLWHKWDGVRYVPAPDDARRECLHVLRTLAPLCGKESELRAMLSDAGVTSVLRLAELGEGLMVTADQFDQLPPYEIALRSAGILDMRSWTVRPYTPDDLITVTARFDTLATDEWATNPDMAWWTDLLDTTLHLPTDSPDDVEALRGAYHRWAGVGATGYTIEHLLVHSGGGSDGKSSLLTAIGHSLGGYAGAANPDHLLDAQSSASAEYERMTLRGRRFVLLSEGAHSLSANDLKRAVTTDTVTGRAPYGHPQTFPATWSLAATYNTLPAVSEAGKRSTQRRLGLLRFRRSFANDKGVIMDRVTGHQPTIDAIGTWVAWGAHLWLSEGRALPTCPMIERDTAEWLNEHDHFASWADGVLVPDPDGWVDRSVLNRQMAAYAHEQNLRYTPTAQRIRDDLDTWLGSQSQSGAKKVGGYWRITGVSWTERGRAGLRDVSHSEDRRAGTICASPSDATHDPDIDATPLSVAEQAEDMAWDVARRTNSRGYAVRY